MMYDKWTVDNMLDNWYTTNIGFRGGTPPVTTKVVTARLMPDIKKVIFNPPATIVFWDDDTKTVVKCMEGREYDKWTGLSMCIAKKLYGKRFKHTFKKWCKDE